MTALALVEALLPRLAQSDPAIWIDRTDPAVLRARAAELDAVPPAERDSMPLWGWTVAVKGNIDVAGWRTTAGCPAYGEVATAHAPVLERLLGAGAILVGTTNLDQFATGLVGTRSPHGTPTNPVDPALVPGGSSSGSAVAVAAGLVDVALGTDTAGSGRSPAAMCEVVGLKPAPGAWPTEGVVPACRSLDCVSVFARTLDAATAAADVIGATTWAPVDRRQRIGVPDAATLARCDPPTASAFRLHLSALRAAGHELVEVDLSGFVAAGDLLYDGPWVAERAASVGDFIRSHPDDVDPVVAGIVLGGFEISGVEVVRGQERLERRQAEMADIWADIDTLVTPTVPFVPTVEDVDAEPVDLNRRLGMFTHPCNLLGLAAISVPGPRRSDGRPSSLTVLAPAGREREIVAGARAAAEPGRHHAVADPSRTDTRGDGLIELAVVGAHLEGQPLHHQLTDRGATLVARTATAPCYRLHALDEGPPTRPGLERVDRDETGASVEVEVWALDAAEFGTFVAAVAPPLAIGNVQLADGRWVKGFVCEPVGLVRAVDVTHHGGWRNYLASVSA